MKLSLTYLSREAEMGAGAAYMAGEETVQKWFQLHATVNIEYPDSYCANCGFARVSR